MTDGSIQEQQCYVNPTYIHYVTLGYKYDSQGKIKSQYTEISWIRGSMPWFVKESIADVMLYL